MDILAALRLEQAKWEKEVISAQQLDTVRTPLAETGRKLCQALNGFQPDFAFLFGAGFANPDHVAAHGVERVRI